MEEYLRWSCTLVERWSNAIILLHVLSCLYTFNITNVVTNEIVWEIGFRPSCPVYDSLSCHLSMVDDNLGFLDVKVSWLMLKWSNTFPQMVKLLYCLISAAYYRHPTAVEPNKQLKSHYLVDARKAITLTNSLLFSLWTLNPLLFPSEHKLNLFKDR